LGDPAALASLTASRQGAKNWAGIHMFTFAGRRVVWMARTLTRSASAPSTQGYVMAVLLIIVLVTVGLSVRAGLYGRRWNVADSDSTEESWLMDACARAFVLVLLSLVGLLALGVMYGNVLGAVHASP
jgi:hypothetical protein